MTGWVLILLGLSFVVASIVVAVQAREPTVPGVVALALMFTGVALIWVGFDG